MEEKAMTKVKEFFNNFKADPGYYFRLWFLSLCGLAVVSFGVSAYFAP